MAPNEILESTPPRGFREPCFKKTLLASIQINTVHSWHRWLCSCSLSPRYTLCLINSSKLSAVLLSALPVNGVFNPLYFYARKIVIWHLMEVRYASWSQEKACMQDWPHQIRTHNTVCCINKSTRYNSALLAKPGAFLCENFAWR